MANLRREMIDMQNEHVKEIERWSQAVIGAAIAGFASGVLLHMFIMWVTV